MARALSLPLAALAASAACELPGAAPAAPVSQRLEGFTLTQTVRGRPAWRLKSPSAKVSPEGRTELSRPEIEFFPEPGRRALAPNEPDSTGSSDQARVEPSGDVDMQGEVVLVSKAERTTLRTERMRYDARRKRFHTEEAVLLERPGALIRGRGMDADSRLSDINIYQQETEVR